MSPLGVFLSVLGGLALIVGVSAYFITKEKRKRRNLWRRVHFALNHRESQNRTIEGYWLGYRTLVLGLDYRASKIAEELTNLYEPTEDEYTRLADLLAPKPRGVWGRYWTDFWYERTPDNLLRLPNLSSKKLKLVQAELAQLGLDQRELIRKFKDALDPQLAWKNGEGEPILISKLEWHSKMRKADDVKEKREQEKIVARGLLDGNKFRLDAAMDYVRRRYSPKSISVGEAPVTAGAEGLTLQAIEDYWRAGVAKIEQMESRGEEVQSIVDYILDPLIVNLEQRFGQKASAIAKLQFSADEIRGEIRQMSKSQEVEITFPVDLTKALNALKSPVPELWSQARWDELDETLFEIRKGLDEGEDHVKELDGWLEEIGAVKARFAGVKAKEIRLKTNYDIAVAPSPDWTTAQKSFDEEALNFWAGGNFGKLEGLLKFIEEPLRQHQFKVTNRLAEADREAGVSSPIDELDVDAKLTTMARATGQPSANQSGARRIFSDPPALGPKVTGKLVTIKTELGIELQVDESVAAHYATIDQNQREREKNRLAEEKKKKKAE